MPVNVARLWIYLLAVLGLAAVVAAMSMLLVRPERPADEGMITLSFHCAAEARLPAEDIIDRFQRRSGIRIQARYAPSHLLLDQIEGSGAGDLLLSTDDAHMHQARRQGLVEEGRPVACLVPVVMVGANAHSCIGAIGDLMAPGIRVGLASSETILGGTTPAILRKNDIQMGCIKDNIAVSDSTAAELAQAVELGQIDAAIVWRPWARYYMDQATAIEIPLERNVISLLVAAVLTTSQHADAARRFVEFLEGNLAQDTFVAYDYACDDLLNDR